MYVGIPATNTFTFTVTGGTLVNTWADATTVPAVGHPINDPSDGGSNNAFLFLAEPITIYAFSLSAGSSSLSITVNPLP